jgi:Ca2+-transporting ATPase
LNTPRSWHSIGPEAVLQFLKSDVHTGLREEEAQRRLEIEGPNELLHEEKTSAWRIFFDQFKNLLIIILIAAVILSAAVGEIVDAAIILAIVLFCAVLGFVQEFRAEKALDALKQMLAPTSVVVRNGREIEIPSHQLVPGDILILATGARVPADARVVESHTLRCNEAPLTGESLPVTKTPSTMEENTPVPERKNMVYTGTTIAYGRGKAVITATGMQTQFGQIAREVATIEIGKTPLEKRTDEIGRWLGGICLTICALVAVISLVRQAMGDSVDFAFVVTVIMFAVALAVAAVPEALAAIVTGALALGMQAMARQNALVRKMPAVETLGCTTVICSDKTGTLTRGEMTVRRIYAAGERIEVAGSGYRPEGSFLRLEDKGQPTGETWRRLLEAGLLCSDAELRNTEDQWIVKGDPTEGALVVAALKAGLDVDCLRIAKTRIEEFAFSSERKRMTTVHAVENRCPLACMKGAPEEVLKRCTHIATAEGIVPLQETERRRIREENEAMASSALRVLAVAFRDIQSGMRLEDEPVETEMTFLGLVGMMDPPREEVREAVHTCRRVHITPVMITGDHKLTAVAIARELDIYRDGDRVLAGEDLASMSDDELRDQVHRISVYARVSPLDKLKIIKAWKARGEVVAMTGDGVNDSPALKQADIGVAMGITGTDVAKEAADMVLTDDNFATIVSAIERGRWIYDNIKKYLAYLLQCNITEVVVIGGIVLFSGPEFLPLLPAAILYINLATDGLPALALGVAPPDRDIMMRPPRAPDESVFGWDVKSFVLRAVIIECPFFFLLYYYHLPDVASGRTAVFFLFVIVEFVIALNCRSLRESIFQAPPHKWLIIALAWEIILIVVLIQIPAVRQAFGINMPSAGELAVITAFGIFVMAIIELTKVVMRRRTDPRHFTVDEPPLQR